MREILDVLFGTHLAGWKAIVQFWTWTILALLVSVLYFRKRIR